MRALLTPLAVIAVVFTVACGERAPASPSAVPDAASGATISGSLIGGPGVTTTSSVRSVTSFSVSGVRVSVVGTSLGASLDAAGGFTLRGVPAGNQELEFSGPSVSGRVGVTGVASNDDIGITVSVSGSDVILESMRRNSAGGEELEGRIEALPPTTPAGSLIVAGRTVATSAATVFRLDGAPATFAALVIGQRVHVTGQSASDALAARAIDIQNTNTDIPVEINGNVQGFSGTPGSFQFSIDGRLIKGDGNTAFFGGSQFSDLANTVRVEVKGLQKNGYVSAARIHVNTNSATPSPTQDDSASIEGILTSKAGAPPTLTLKIAGTTVTTNSATEVQRKGDVQDLSVLALNMTIHVVGTRQSDGSILARKLQIKDDAPGGAFEISGSVGGLKGSCPSLSFGVNGYAVTTDATTVFAPGCSGLKSGSKVTVQGVVQAGGTVAATKVTVL